MKFPAVFLFKNFIIGLILVTLAGCWQKSSSTSPVVAKFKGGQITKDEFIQKLERLPKEIKAAATQQKKAFLEELIDEHFLEQEAIRQKINQDPDVKDTINQARRKIIISKLVEDQIDKKAFVDSDEAKRFYDANQDKFMTPLMFRASHILVKTEEEAKAMKTKLTAGADFEELAREKSIHNTAIVGGDVGFFQKGKLIPEFEEAAFNLKKGEISDVVKSQFGYHLIKLTDRIEPLIKSFEAVKELIQKQIIIEKRSELFKNYVANLRGGVKVTIDEKVLEASS